MSFKVKFRHALKAMHFVAEPTMMYGFGDDPTPYKESVELVEV